MARRTWVFGATLVALIALDQITKYFVEAHVGFRDEIELIPGFLSIIHARNPGAAFSMLRDYEHRIWVFVGFNLIATGIVLDLWRRLPRDDAFHSFTLGMILSGALGNLVDRIFKDGIVTDFIRVYTDAPALRDWLLARVHTAEWPTFNVADSALVVGVGLFLVHYLFLEDRADDPPPAEAPPPPAGA